MTATTARRLSHRMMVLGLLVAGAAHIPVTPEHLREASYMGVAFIAFTVTAVTLAAIIAARPTLTTYRFARALSLVAIAMYALTRLVAFPDLADDVGNWTETLGLVSLGSEGAIALAATAAIRLRRRGSPRAAAAAPVTVPAS